MLEVRETAQFVRWMSRLRDHVAMAIIAARVDRLKAGNALATESRKTD